MMSLAKPHKTIKDILLYPARTLPGLSQEELQMILIKCIQSYRKHEIALETLVRFSNKILRYKTVILPENMQQIIEEIQSFSSIDFVLLDILQELKESKRKKGIHS